ncbi:MAG: hypothetical protein WD648_04255, partial [Planctomycetaceae bacterium]
MKPGERHFQEFLDSWVPHKKICVICIANGQFLCMAQRVLTTDNSDGSDKMPTNFANRHEPEDKNNLRNSGRE